MAISTDDWPQVCLGDNWPLASPQPPSTWAPPLSRIRLASGDGAHIRSWGDAVPGGYNGSFAAYDPRDNTYMGRLDYQSARHEADVLIAYIEVEPAWRGRGVSDALLMRLAHEFPERTIAPGLMTAEGVRWWQRVRAALGERAGT